MGEPTASVPIRLRTLVLVAVAAVALGYGLRKATAPGESEAPSASADSVESTGSATDPVPRLAFELRRLGGGDATAADFAGRVVVVDLWATWCGPCRIQAEILHALAEEYANERVSFLAVNVGEPEELVRDFVEDEPFAYPVLLDPAEILNSRYGVYALPTVLVADGSLAITYRHIGIAEEADLRMAIDAALASGRAAPARGSERASAGPAVAAAT